ncbi:MAG TPA: glycosyltransferase family protein, partial [Kineobactrum sp.]
MKILYGVQATGNGHISRARAMAEALAAHDVEVTWLFSGRARQQLFDMAPFGDFLHRRGLTFISRAGRIDYGRTLVHNNLWQFLRDVHTLPLAGFDAIVTDFEPVTAWAGRRARLPVIGIGHQYALGGTTPTVGGHWLARQIMNHFAPVTRPLGLHWHPYADNVLPPILHLPDRAGEPGEDILVYLPFEGQQEITQLLQQFPQHRFRQYASGLAPIQAANVL